MGYYSDVKIVINKRVKVLELIQAVKFPEEMKDYGDVFDLNNDEEIWSFTEIKWYGSFERIQKIMKFLESLDDEDYGFIRIGENTEDIEYLGDPGKYRMYVHQEIVIRD